MKPQPRTLRHYFRWTLRGLLLLFIPLCVALAWYGQVERQRQQASDAIQLMCGKGIDANFRQGQVHTLSFKNGNVTDADLAVFARAFNGHAPAEWQDIRLMRLHGSPISADAAERFRKAAPQCRLEP